ncbi:glycosyltransferase [Bacillus sp. 1P02SD]|uniref:glycosyltransferase family protein n=1 Tax=Bacillus sp. 1P02SD TaxID=3132264 RepID=UPI00399FDAD4
MEKLKILILVRPFWHKFPIHKVFFDTIQTIGKFADVRYWYHNGDIYDIIHELNFKPDFILHYDIAWGSVLSPSISGLDQINIPKGCFVIDTHFNTAIRRKYFDQNKTDLIFSVTKASFLRTFPEYKEKFRWLPFAINPEVFKDWHINKEIDYLLMGAVNDPEGKTPNLSKTGKGIYPFREEVLVKMRGEEGFVFHPHPGLHGKEEMGTFINKDYAKELNRSKTFFTCGSRREYPVLKFFEAPACKTLLLAEPVPDILDLGFEDGVNFVACNKVNVHEKALYYIKNDEERQRITENGYSFIHNHHTNDVRAQELVAYIKSYIDVGRTH